MTKSSDGLNLLGSGRTQGRTCEASSQGKTRGTGRGVMEGVEHTHTRIFHHINHKVGAWLCFEGRFDCSLGGDVKQPKLSEETLPLASHQPENEPRNAFTVFAASVQRSCQGLLTPPELHR